MVGTAGAGTLPQIGVAAYTAARARATGPTNKQINLTLVDGFWEGRLDALQPGSYSVTVEGLEGGEVVAAGTTAGVTVTAGTETPATVSLTSVIPSLTLGITSPTTSLVIPVTVGTVSYSG